MNLRNNYKVKNLGWDIEPHEVFLDKMAKAKEEELGITEKKLEVPLKEKIAYSLLGIFLFFMIILFSKTFYLQVIEGKRLYSLGENNKGEITLIRPERGVIYDRNLKKLVLNSPAFDLICDKRRFLKSTSKSTKEIQEIAEVLAKDPEILKKEIEDSEESMVLVAENISHETLLVLEAKINDFSTCQIEKNTVRDYVFGESFSHLLGFTSRINKEELVNVKDYAINDYIGKIGLEKSYEEILRGKPGKVEAEKNVFGRKSGGKILSEPEAGKNLVLSVDSDLQNKIYDELKKGVKKIGSQKGAAVAIDPKTGYILALVSYPSFDNNNFSKGISQEEFNKLQNDILKPFFNRPVSGQYPPGSTIKPLIAAAGLQEKIILPDKEIYDPGFISIVNKYNPGIVYYFNDLKPHGWVSMRKAIAQSCNVYFYTIGGGYGDQQGLGSSRIKKYLELFGWGNKTGIDIPGEVNGLIPDPAWKKVNKGESWWDGDTYHLSIGQGDLKVTPLQVAVAFAAIANGGTLYQPKIVQKIIDNQTGSIEEITPTILRKNFIDAANLQVVKEGMREAVTNGIVTSLNTLPVKAAAKTGTAQISKENYYDTWVTVFAPYENPQIVLSIVVEEVPGLSTVVVPIAKEVLNWYFTQ